MSLVRLCNLRKLHWEVSFCDLLLMLLNQAIESKTLVAIETKPLITFIISLSD